MTLAMYPARSFTRLSRDGGIRRGGTTAGAFVAGAFADDAAVLPELGAGDGVAGARVHERATNVTPTNAKPVRPTMIDLGQSPIANNASA